MKPQVFPGEEVGQLVRAGTKTPHQQMSNDNARSRTSV